MPRRFPRLRGDSRLYPFAARTALRRRQKHRAWALRLCGAAVLCLAAGLILRDTVFRGGQPEAPVTTAESTEQPSPTPIAITPRAATVDVLAAAESADSDVHSSPAPHPSPDAAQAADILPQYQELYAQNPDLAGWLCINGTNINYPVVQADNSYYLRRGFDRLYSTAGTLFLDERCRLATPNAAGTANALIYGHNTASGSMFSQLLNYADKAFYTAHPTFQFDTLYEEGTWQVAAVLRTELGADALPYYSFFDASTQEEWQQRVDAILELSLYDTGVVPQYGDQLLTLSTCHPYTRNSQRYLVIAEHDTAAADTTKEEDLQESAATWDETPRQVTVEDAGGSSIAEVAPQALTPLPGEGSAESEGSAISNTMIWLENNALWAGLVVIAAAVGIMVIWKKHRED